MKKLLFFIFLLSSLTGYSQEKRLALVIGNSAYEHGGVLKNPVNDANAMKQALSQIGFEVLEHFNLDEGEMKQAIDYFGLKLRNYDVGLFFYAGHGIQVGGTNYLIPIEVNLMSEQQVEYDCVEAARVLAHMDASGASVNIIILDACRNNPFERSWSRSTTGQGLAFMQAPSGTLLAYATSPGSVASDGIGVNGLYTEAILENIFLPDLSILEMFQNVRNTVNVRSNLQQTPWESTSLVGNFYFNKGDFAPFPVEIGSDIRLETEAINERANSIEDEFAGEFIDIRDSQSYKWVRYGEQVWMAENLNYITLVGSWCYEHELINCDIYGRLYNFETANNACPSGWHLPSEYEWKVFMNFHHVNTEGYLLGMVNHYWDSISYEITVDCGFNALPGGIRNLGFGGLGFQANFHSSTSTAGGSRKFKLTTFSKELQGFNGGKFNGVSIRCVKDKGIENKAE